jgi:hypothetical protein
MALMLLTNIALADEIPMFELRIKDHKFNNPALVVPANQKFKLKIINEDPSSEEFESASMTVEKFIGPKKTISITLGPLKPGTYDYFGEFHRATCTGKLTAK